LSGINARATRLDHWDLFLDEGNCRHPEDLPAAWTAETVAVQVPHVWEQVRPEHDGVGWYRQALQVTEADLAAGQTWRLHVSDGGYTPFWADLTPALRPGPNELLIRVVDPPREYPVEGLQSSHPLRQTALPTYKAGWYYSFGGLWQPVRLLRTGPVWLEDAFIQPRPGLGGVRVEYRLEGAPAPTGTLRYQVISRRDGQVYAEGTQPVRGTRGEFEVDLPGAPRWSCEDPHLLELRLELETGTARDARNWRFGLREFTTDGTRFLLNGRPIHLRGVLHQGGFPRTIVFPQDEEMARKDIRAILDAGCNLSRITLRPASPMELDLCDEMGLLVIGEPPIGWIAWDEEVDGRCLAEVREMILRDRNRPSVVLWTLLNEFSDTVYFRHQDPGKLIRAAIEEALKLDPTRLMTGNSGKGAMETDDVPNGLFGQGRKPTPIDDLHIYLRNFPSANELRSRIIDAGKDGGEGGVLLVSEFGTSGFPNLDRALDRYTPAERALGLEDYRQMANYREEVVRGWQDFRLDRFYKDLPEFYHALAHDQAEMVRLETRALRLNPRVAGYIITQGADSSSEWGGIVDLWREPKRVYEVYRALNRPRVLLLHTDGQQFAQGSRVRVTLRLSDVTGAESECRGRVRALLGGEEIAAWDFGGNSAWNTELAARDLLLDRPGAWTLVAEATCAGETLRDERVLTSHAAPALAGRAVLLMDTAVTPHGGKSTPVGELLAGHGLEAAKYHNQDNAAGRPVLVRLKGRDQSLQYFEQQLVLRREVEAGRNVIFVDCDLGYLSYFFNGETPREIYGNGSYAGNMGFAFAPELFPHLGPERQITVPYGACYPRVMPEARQALAQGAEILALHAMPYQFGRPDRIEWGASLYTRQIGEGRVWVCAFRLWEALEAGDPVALDMLDRLLRAAGG
jgi:hypothetical protein